MCIEALSERAKKLEIVSITRRPGLQIVACSHDGPCAVNSSENVRTGATCASSIQISVSPQSKVWNKMSIMSVCRWEVCMVSDVAAVT